MDEFVVLMLSIGIMLGGMDVITRPVPIFNKIYRRLLRFFFIKPAKAAWRRVEKATRKRRKAIADWLWSLPWRGLCALGRGVRWAWVRLTA